MRSERSGRPAAWGLRLAALGGVLFLNLPLAFILLYAFTTDDRTFSFPPPALTLKWFAVAWGRGDIWEALFLSVRVAAAATLLAMILGTLAAAAMYRFQFFGKEG